MIWFVYLSKFFSLKNISILLNVASYNNHVYLAINPMMKNNFIQLLVRHYFSLHLIEDKFLS